LDYVCCLYLISGEDAVSTSGMIIPDYEISYAPLSLERAVEIFLMFNYSNLMSVCHACHSDIHRKMFSHSKAAIKANNKRITESFVDKFLK